MDLRKRVEEFDFESASARDVAVLLEQVFLYLDTRTKDGGPVITAEGIINRYSESVRRKAAPELHLKVTGRCIELRSTLSQFDSLLRSLEKDNAQTRP